MRHAGDISEAKFCVFSVISAHVKNSTKKHNLITLFTQSCFSDQFRPSWVRELTE